jgi:hypothetical protein
MAARKKSSSANKPGKHDPSGRAAPGRGAPSRAERPGRAGGDVAIHDAAATFEGDDLGGRASTT